MEPIIIKIDVTKIEKARLFEGKNGAKYLDCVAWPSDYPDQYGNEWRIVQSVSKEERQQGVKGAIIGSGKNMQSRQQSAPRQQQRPAPRAAARPTIAEQASAMDGDDIPFAPPCAIQLAGY